MGGSVHRRVGAAVTAFELNLAIQGKAGFIDRHRPLLFHMEIVLCLVGIFFYIGGMFFDGVFRESTWGEWAYFIPAWVWGAVNAIGAAIAAFGLVRPVKNCMVAVGAAIHLIQFTAIFQSCVFSGGDVGIALYGLGLAALHAKLLYEALLWSK